MRSEQLTTFAALVAACGTLFTGCDGSSPIPAEARSARVATVSATTEPLPLSQWCELFSNDPSAPAITLPPRRDASGRDATAELPKDRWVWINLWATWCGPCLREIPFVERFSKELQREGHSLELIFLSLDDDPDLFSSFVAKADQTALRHSLRISDPVQVGSWFERLGLSKDTAIPVNLFLDSSGRLRCARTGSFGEGDFPVIQQLFTSPALPRVCPPPISEPPLVPPLPMSFEIPLAATASRPPCWNNPQKSLLTKTRYPTG